MSSSSKSSGIALLSSGLDSSVALAMYLATGAQVRLALTVLYGQRASDQEVKHAREISAYFKIPHQTLDLSWMGKFPSALTHSQNAMPNPSRAELDDAQFTHASAKAVWVPNRNGIFLEAASGFAETLGASHVIVGFNREEAATFPDNSSSYLNAINMALAFSTQGRVQIVSPTVMMDKTEIVAWARANNFPLHLVWSCYEAREKMCGRCESCQRLKRAIDDPLFIASRFETGVAGLENRI